MKIKLLPLCLLFSFGAASAAMAADHEMPMAEHASEHAMDHSMSMKAPENAAATDPLAEAKAAYPLKTCVVSGEDLDGDSMGGPFDYVYKEEGKPDRLVRFCCKMCLRDFKKDPAKYLKKIDEAAKSKAETKQ